MQAGERERERATLKIGSFISYGALGPGALNLTWLHSQAGGTPKKEANTLTHKHIRTYAPTPTQDWAGYY